MIYHLTIISFIFILAKAFLQNDSKEIEESVGSCWKGQCDKYSLVAFLVLGIIVIILLFIGCSVLLIILCQKLCRRNRTYETNTRFLNDEDIKASEDVKNELIISININNIFKSGLWYSQYYQYSGWHVPSQHKITFNIDENTLYGSGIDDIGQFTLNGSISTEYLTINMIKKYIWCTGNAHEHLGNEVNIDLEWDNNKNIFIGQWSVDTETYSGKGQYELAKVQGLFKNKEQDSPI